MSDPDGPIAVVAALAFAGLGLWAGLWWVWVPMLVVTVLCVLAAIPVGDAAPHPRQESLDEIAETLRSIERSQYS